MRKLLVFLFLVSYLAAAAQDGKILEQTKFEVPDSLKNYKSRTPMLFYSITYLSDGLKIKGFVAIPDDSNIHPGVVFNRGGNESYSMLTNESFARKAGFLLDNGYMFAATQYRGSTGSEGKDELGGDVNDVINLVLALRSFRQFDTSRVGLFGWSRGAINTYMALTKMPAVKAVVVGGGFSDLLSLKNWRKAFDSALYAKLIPQYRQTKNEDLLKVRSAFYFAGEMPKTAPILLLHGTADGNVPATQSINLAQKFYELNLPFRLILYEGGIHSLEQFRAEYEAEIIKWFNKYLRDGKKPPSLEPAFRR